MIRLGGILIGLCIVIIAVSLGVVLYVKLRLPLIDSGLVAGFAALLLLVLQGLAARSRERAEYLATIDELRRAGLHSRDELGRIGDRVQDLDGVGHRVSSLEAQVGRGLLAEIETRIAAEVAATRASLASEMQVIETLVRQLAETLAASQATDGGARAAQAGEPPAGPAESDWPSEAESVMEMEADAGAGAEDAAEEDGTAVLPDALADAPPADDLPDAPADDGPARPHTPLGHLADDDMLALVRRSIQDNRVDIYLQPIVRLPQRRARYYEALTRLRDEDGEPILPADYLRVAGPAGIMPMIDNLLLFRSVQIVRRLAQRNRDVGIFCNISVHTLVDPDFFPQFVEFMQHNAELAGAIVFEFPQAVVDAAGPIEIESLYALREQGFRFSLDHVTSLAFDAGRLADLGFRFVKVAANLLLDDAARTGAQIHPADLSSLLARYGIELVAEKIEDEATVVELLDFDVAYGQGYLFSEPRPVRSELMHEAGAAEAMRKAV